MALARSRGRVGLVRGPLRGEEEGWGMSWSERLVVGVVLVAVGFMGLVLGLWLTRGGC